MKRTLFAVLHKTLVSFRTAVFIFSKEKKIGVTEVKALDLPYTLATKYNKTDSSGNPVISISEEEWIETDAFCTDPAAWGLK